MEAIYSESLINPTEESKREDAVGTASAVLLQNNREVITKELSASKPSRHDRSGGDVKDATEYRDHLSNHVHYTIQTFTSISGAGEPHDMSLDRRSSYNQDKVHSCSEGFTEVDGATLSVRIQEEPRDLFYVLTDEPGKFFHWQIKIDRKLNATLFLGKGRVTAPEGTIDNHELFWYDTNYTGEYGYLKTDGYYVVLDTDSRTAPPTKLKMTVTEPDNEAGYVYMKRSRKLDGFYAAVFYFSYRGKYYKIIPDTKNLTLMVTEELTKPDDTNWTVKYP